MARLGFDRRSGFVYEGRDSPAYPVWPNPVVSQATLIGASQDFSKIPQNFESSPWGWVFREDSFDPVSKIRRGRLFQKHGNQGWEDMKVEVHPAIRTDEVPARNNGGRLRKELSVFIECTELLQLPNRGEGARLALGVAGSYALWRIVQVESTLNLDVLVTLRAESAFGVLPALDTSRIAPESLQAVESALARVLDAAYRELPTSVVDQCRNAATVIAARWMWQQTGTLTPEDKDLGKWVNVIATQLSDRRALVSTLEIIRVLHPRGKDNERSKLGLRAISDGDAELAVHCISFLLREVGWAKD
jgi:hypothetical protein